MTFLRPGLRLNLILLFVLLSGLIIVPPDTFAQKDPLKAAYIEQYSALAVSEMRRSGIPASITMAQAILESNIGRSDLATKANNHFGIKCHLEWKGKRFYYDDDEKDECFRVYENSDDSFFDHSVFLLTRDRYRSLFDLDPSDYKAWAKGLKKAGYATNPKYADILIRIIEEENLYHLDSGILPAVSRNTTADNMVMGPEDQNYRPFESSKPPYHNRNRIDFVIASKGETVSSLTEKLDLLKWEIRKYNELNKREEVQEGSIVYLQPKRKRAARGFDIHIVGEGESLYSISQHFGIKTKWLLKRNRLQEGDTVDEGQRIWLRGNKPEVK